MKQLGIIFKTFFFATIPSGLISFSACSSHSDHLEISGNISNYENSWILLRDVADNQVITIDSTSTNDSGDFYFSLELTESPMFVLMQFKNEVEPIVLLVEHGEKVSITGLSGRIARNYRVTGSKGSLLVHQININLNKTVTQIDSLSRLFRENREHPRFDSIKHVVDSCYNRLLSEHKKFTVDFIKANRYSLSSVLALYQKYDSRREVLNQRDDFELFKLVDSSLYPLYPKNKLVENLHQNVKEMAKQLDLYDKRSDMIAVDDYIPGVNFPLLTNEAIAIGDFWVRYILIDFWATWCKSCTPNNAELKRIYNDYKSKGFEIIQFSLDNDKDLLTDYVNRDSTTWYHASDFMAWESPILDSLHINTVPANYLVDRRGKVIARNLNPNQLREQLKNLLP